MAEIEGLLVELGVSAGRFEEGFSRAAQRAEQSSGRIEGATGRIDRACARLESTTRATLRAVTAEFGALAAVVAGGALSADRIVQYADAWKRTGNQLVQVAGGSRDLLATQEALFAIAQKSRQGFDTVVDVYTKGAKAARELGATQDQLRKFTEGVALATTLSGKSASEQAGAMTQLGQLLNSSRVRAEEYNSVLEGSPRIAQAVADGLAEAGGSVGRLKRLVDDGKVSNEAFFKAFLSQLPRLQAEFAKLSPTIEEAGRVFDNALGRLIGRSDEAVGATALVARAIIGFSADLETAARYAALAGGTIATLLVARGLGPLLPALAQGVAGFATLVGSWVKAEAAILSGASAVEAYRDLMPGLSRSLQIETEETLKAAQAAQAKARADLAARAAQYEHAVALDGAIGRTARLAEAEAAHAAARVARTAADERAAAALAAHTAATERATLAARAGTVAGRAFAGALALVGGWSGAAILAAGFALLALASRTSEAAQAATALDRAQRALDSSVVKTGEGAAVAADRYAHLSAEMKEVERANLTRALGEMQAALLKLRDAGREALYGAGAGDLMRTLRREAPELQKALADVFAVFRADPSAEALPRLVKALSDLSARASGPTAEALRSLAVALGESAAKAESTGRSMDRVRALLTLLDDPANTAARAVLGLGTAGEAAAGGLSAAGTAAGMAADDFKKAADGLRDMAATYAMSEAAKKAFEAKTASPAQRTLLTALADEVEALDDYKKALKERDTAEAASQIERAAALAAAEASAVRTLTIAEKLKESARAVAEGTMTMAAARAMAEREGDAAGVDAYTKALERMRAAFGRIKKEADDKKAAFNPATSLADFAKEAGATVAGLKRMATAYAQGETAVEAATRAQEVETRLLKLGEGARAAVVKLVDEEADARRALDLAKWVAETERQTAAAARLATAEGEGVAAVEEANTVNAVAEEQARQRVATGSAEAGVIDAKVRALEAENRRRRDNATLKAAETDLATARAELSVMGLTEEARARALDGIRAQARAVELFGDTTSDAARRYLALQDQLADTRATERALEAIRSTAETIADDVTNSLFDAITLQDREASLMDTVRGLLRRLALEFLKQQIFLPVSMAVVGSVPQLFGLSSAGAAAGAVAGAAGGARGSGGPGWLSSAGNLLGNGFNLSSVGLYGLGQSISMSGIGTALGLSTIVSPAAATAAGVMPVAGGLGAAGGTALSGAGSLFSQGLAASPWGLIGGLGANLLGLGGGIGGTIGGLVGSVGGGIAGSSLGTILGMAGGPVGAVLGSFLGTALGGMFGGKKSVGPNAQAYSERDYSTGQVLRADAAADNGGSTEAVTQLVGGLEQSVAAFAQAVGAAPGKLLIAATQYESGTTVRLGGGEGYGTVVSSSGDQDKAAGDLIRFLTRNRMNDATPVMGAPQIKLSDFQMRAVRDGVGAQEMTADIGFLKSIEDGRTALKDFDKSLKGVETAAKKAQADALAPLTDELEHAQKLGSAAEYKDLVGGQLRQLLAGIADAPEYSQTQQQLATLAGQMQAVREAAQGLGLDLTAETQAAEERAKARLRSDFEAQLQATSEQAAGREYITQIRDLARQMDAAKTDATALGSSVDGVSQTYNRLMANIVSGLDETQLRDVIAVFGDLGGASARLATLMADAARQQADAAAALTADLTARGQTVLGRTGAAALTALDQRQRVELAAARAANQNTGFLEAVQAAERATAAFDAARTDLVEALTRQERAVTDNSAAAREAASRSAAFAASIRQAVADRRLAPYSGLSTRDRLDEARRQVAEAYTAAMAGDEAARSRFVQLVNARDELAFSWYGISDTSDFQDSQAKLAALGLAADTEVDTQTRILQVADQQLDEIRRARESAERLGERQLDGTAVLTDRLTTAFTAMQSALARLGARPEIAVDEASRQQEVARLTGAIGATWDRLRAGGSSEAAALGDPAYQDLLGARYTMLGQVTDTGWLTSQLTQANANGWAPYAGQLARRLEALSGRSAQPELQRYAEYVIGQRNALWDELSAAGLDRDRIFADPRFASLTDLQNALIAEQTDPAWLRRMLAANNWGGGTVIEQALQAQLQRLTGFAAGGVTGRVARIHNDELLYTGPPARVYSAAETRALFAAANDRASPNVAAPNVIDLTARIPAGGASASAPAVEAGLARVTAMLERLIGAVERGDDENAVATSGVVQAVRGLAAELRSGGEPVGARRMAAGR